MQFSRPLLQKRYSAAAARTPASHRRARQARLLIIGCGDVGQRVLPLARYLRVLVLTSQAANVQKFRKLGAVPLLGNLDDAVSLKRLAGLAHWVLHLAPPHPQDAVEAVEYYQNSSCLRSFLLPHRPNRPIKDSRNSHLSRVLRRGTRPRHGVYGSTSGVYGDCAGAWIDETRGVNPQTERARRRVAAESALRTSGLSVSILRIPGIYALDRSDGTPATRLQKGTPVLQAADDVFTNHIHADDLARACWLALWRGKPQRVYHISDDAELKMGDYFDLAADMLNLPRPPRLPRAELEQQLSPMQMSFLRESRRLQNARMQRELRLKLRYPTPKEGLQNGQ